MTPTLLPPLLLLWGRAQLQSKLPPGALGTNKSWLSTNLTTLYCRKSSKAVCQLHIIITIPNYHSSAAFSRDTFKGSR